MPGVRLLYQADYPSSPITTRLCVFLIEVAFLCLDVAAFRAFHSVYAALAVNQDVLSDIPTLRTVHATAP